LIATSALPRHQVGAEALARDDVLFLPKPLNVPFLVGMVAGCIGSGTAMPRLAERRLETGDVLLREGDSGSLIFVVQFGLLRAERETDGRSVVVGTVRPGELAGEIAFLRNSPRAATLVADEPTSVLELDLDDVHDYLDAQPSWLRALIDSLIKRVNDTTELTMSAGRGSPLQ
jgi:CRP-like cAMP-binding protein